jgi:hypothetical protein
MVQVVDLKVLLAAWLRLPVRCCDARVYLQNNTCIRANGLTTGVQGFADAKAGAKGRCAGDTKEWGTIEDTMREGNADDRSPLRLCGFETICNAVSTT